MSTDDADRRYEVNQLVEALREAERERDEARVQLDLVETALRIKDAHNQLDCAADHARLRIERDAARARADELRDEVRYWIKAVNLGGDPGAHWPSTDPKEQHPWEVEQ